MQAEASEVAGGRAERVLPAADPQMLAEIDYLRTSGVLGTNGRQLTLFDFLVRATLEGRSAKETEIAHSVFEESPSTSGSSVARVYVYRLRRRLEEIYNHTDNDRPVRVSIPRGEYRLTIRSTGRATVAEVVQPAPSAASAAPGHSNRWPVIAAIAAVLLVVANIAAWVAFSGRPEAKSDIARSPLWAQMASDSGPLLIVVGDYYMFGEYENQVQLRRLIHDFEVNSKEDLMARYIRSPDKLDVYSDVATRYLPASAGFAIADMAPLLRDRSDVQVKMASDLTPNDLKSSDIIYVGLVNGMGPLRDRVFARSRYAMGKNFNEFRDTKSGETYVSEAAFAAPTDTMYRDYGFLSAFQGVGGNRIVVIAGAQDTALMGMTASLMNPGALEFLSKASEGARDLEALYEIKGQRNVDLQTNLLSWQNVDSKQVWTPLPPDDAGR